MTLHNKKLEKRLAEMPVVAIIRGVQPEEVVAVGHAIADAGINVIEVPLNSPQPFVSIEKLSNELGDECVIGCGTLTQIDDVQRVANAGGEIAVTPSTQPKVIERCVELNLTPMPGWATPTEAFNAYHAGARYLKLFPAASYGVGHFKAVRAVLPSDCKVLAVGGVGAGNAQQWLSAGIDGFGIGSELFKVGDCVDKVARQAKSIVEAIHLAKNEESSHA